MAIEQSTLQMELAKSVTFIDRLAYTMCQQARTVKSEALSRTGHAKRSIYADKVITWPLDQARAASPTVVGGVNLLPPTATIVTAADGTKDTNATDAALLSQVSTFWDALSGVDTGS